VTEKTADGVDVEIEQPHTHSHTATGHAWLDKVLPVSALFVSLISILIAFHHGKVMQELVHQNERLVQANSLPYLTLSAGTSNDEAGFGRTKFTIANGGVGPAEIRSTEVLLNGQPVRNARQLLAECCQITTTDGLFQSSPTNLMIRPGVSVDYIDLRQMNRDTAAGMGRLYETIAQRRVITRLCYCSVFDECWTRTSTDARPTPVDQCPTPSIPYGH